MSNRVFILAFVSATLSLTIALTDNHSSESRQIAFTLPKIGDLNGIRVVRSDRSMTELRRRKDDWFLKNSGVQISEHNDQLLTDTMATSISMDMDLGRVEELDKYGLGPYSLTVEFIGADETRKIRVGKVVNDQLTFIYDELSNHVYRARANLRQVFDRTRLDWRERQLFGLDYSSVMKIESRIGQNLIWSASRADTKAPWAFTYPKELDLGQDEIAAVVNTMVQSRAVGFKNEPDGFAEQRRLKITTVSGENYGLAIGQPNEDGQLPVRRISGANPKMTFSTWIAWLPKHQAIFLKPTLDDLKNKRVFGFSVQDIKGISWTGDERFALKKSAENWVVTWNGKRKILDRASSDSYQENFTMMKALKVDLIGPKTPFVQGDKTVSIELKNGEKEVVYLGQTYGTGQFVRTRSKPNQAMLLSKPTVETLFPAVSRLFN